MPSWADWLLHGAETIGGGALEFVPGIGQIAGTALIGMGVSGLAGDVGNAIDSANQPPPPPQPTAASGPNPQEGAIASQWNSLIGQNQAADQALINQNQIFDPNGNRVNSGFWNNIGAEQADLSAGFANQQHSLTGNLASRGLLGTGQEAASRAAMSGAQASTLSNLQNQAVQNQLGYLQHLQQAKNSDLTQLQLGQASAMQGLYGTDLSNSQFQQQLATEEQQNQTAGLGSLLGAGATVAGDLLGNKDITSGIGNALSNLGKPGVPPVAAKPTIAAAPTTSNLLGSLQAPTSLANPVGSPPGSLGFGAMVSAASPMSIPPEFQTHSATATAPPPPAAWWHAPMAWPQHGWGSSYAAGGL